MSEVSVLSHEYKTASELSRAVNDMVIALKKEHYGLSSGDPSARDGLAAQRQHLSDILITLAGLLDPDGKGEVDQSAAAQVSGALLTRLRAEKGGELAYYVDDLRSTTSRLRREACKLTDSDLARLDSLAATASAEASRVYRRLMRK